MKSKLYNVTDCETATLPFADAIAHGDSERKKRIAIARPLIYDLGWTLVNRKGEIQKKAEYLVAETFCVPAIFNTAYYAQKRPIYLEKIERGELTIKPWNDIMREYVADLERCDAVGAFNSMFDFKKAIPFTELYIRKLYSRDYYSWEKIQQKICESIANKAPFEKKTTDFDGETFYFRGREYPLFDLWGLATSYLLNTATYKKECLEHNMLTNSGVFFKTSAESTYRYLMDMYDFDEAHTALDDSIIESYILSRVAARHAISLGIQFFPFRDLGTTDDFCASRRKVNRDHCRTVIDAMETYLDTATSSDSYRQSIENRIERLRDLIGE